MQDYNICYSLDSNYTEQLAVSVLSILKNAKSHENINFYILDGGLTEQDKNNIEVLKQFKDFNIEYISVASEDFKTCPMLKEKSEAHNNYHVTIPTYYRFKLPEYLPNLDKVLYLDCDIIVNSSLENLYNTNIKDFAAAMVKDAESDKEAKRLNIKNYFNAGVMLINLDYWHKNDIEKQLFDYAVNNKDDILWQDQDIVNSVLNGKIKELDNIWNFQYFQYENIDISQLSSCNIFHLAGRFKPWFMPFEHPIYDIYYYYLSFTEWKNKIVEYKLNSAGKHLKDNLGGAVTNILINSTDKDIEEVYDKTSKFINERFDCLNNKINASNDFVKERYADLEFKLNSDAQEKFDKVYEEIDKSNDFVKERYADLEFKLNSDAQEKFDKVYEEIDKSNDFVKERYADLEFKLNSDAQGKFDKVYEEINNTNEFIKERYKDLDYNITKNTDAKIDRVYEEITKNYGYTNDKHNELKELIISSQTELQNTKSEQNLFEQLIEGKLEYNNKLNDEALSKVYDEINNNVKYIESIVAVTEEKQNNKINLLENKIEEDINKLKQENENKIEQKAGDLYYYTDNKFQELEKIFNSKINDISDNITIKHDSKYNELYCFTNEQTSNLYKEIKDTSICLEKTMNNKIFDLYKNNEDVNSEISALKDTIKSKPDNEDLQKMLGGLKQKISDKDTEQIQNIENIKSDFEERLNKQRIKYEKKLIDMENQLIDMNNKLKDMQKNPIEKFIDRIKKSEKRK